MSFLKKLFGFGKKSEKKTPSFHSDNKSQKPGSLMLALEERYLYDAAGVAAAFLPLAAKQHADAPESHHTDNVEHTEVTAEKSLPDLLKNAVPPAADQHPTEIVFVDSTVTDYQKIVETLPANAQVIILDPNRDGVTQISEVLSQQKDVQAIHIVSHGSDASLTLGNTELSKNTIDKYAPMLTTWKDSLKQGADILIYGCDVARDADGKAFVNRISQLTGADTAASDNLTGAAAKGGDWILEYQTGWIDAKALNPRGYDGRLANIFVNSTADGPIDHTDDATNLTLRDAIDLANQTPAVSDSISFNVAVSGGTITLLSDLPAFKGETLISIDKNLTIDGAGFKIDGGGTSGVISPIFDSIATVATIKNLTITNANDNVTGREGGGILCSAGTLNIDKCTISNNKSGNLTAIGGAGICVRNGATVNVTNSTISGNVDTCPATNGGGILVKSGGTLNITNSTVAQNSANGFGGGIRVDGTATINNCTIVDNNGSVVGGDYGVRNNGGAVTIRSSIIWSNTRGETTGGYTNGGNNLIGTDPLFSGGLQNNGGTTYTYALTSTSPARNAGSNTLGLPTDQRGVTRVIGASADIGSYEYNPVNTPPVATGTPTVAPTEDTTYTFASGNFNYFDADGDAMQAIQITTLPDAAYGVLQISGADVVIGTNNTILAANIGNLTFVPVANKNGNTSFKFMVQDNNATPLWSAAADMAVNITAVPDAPTVTPVTIVSTLKNTNYPFASGNFNFSDVDGDALQAIQITGLPAAADGKLELPLGTAVVLNQIIPAASIGNLVFVPAANVTGVKTFNFKVQDNSTSNLWSTDYVMSVNVAAGINNPTSAPGNVTINEDTIKTFASTDFPYTDADDVPVGADPLTAIQVTSLPPSADGVLKLSGVNVTLNQVIPETNIGNLTFEPALNKNGSSSFTFKVEDNTARWSAADYTMSINITPVNDPPTAVNDSGIIIIKNSLNNSINVLSNDSDIDGDALNINTVTSPTLHGGTAVKDASGKYVIYTPAAGYIGPDSFTYTIADGNGGISTAATVNITVTSTSASPDVIFASKNTPIAFNVLSNDAGTGIIISAYDVITSKGGMVSLVNSADKNGVNFAYMPAADFLGWDSFTYTIISGTEKSTATVTIGVDPVVVKPTATADAFTAEKNTPITVKYSEILKNDKSNVADQTLTITDLSPLEWPANGTLVFGADSFTYTPKTGFSGSDVFYYSIANSTKGTDRTSVTISVPYRIDPPILTVPSAVVSNEDTPVYLTPNEAYLEQRDGTQYLEIHISGVPYNAALSAGTKNADGTWTLTQDQMPNLTLTMPENLSAKFTLTVDAVATKISSGETAHNIKPIAVEVIPIADAPLWNTASHVSGAMGQPVDLQISKPVLTDTDGSEYLSDVTISGVPQWATLSAGQQTGTDKDGNGIWTVSADAVSGLKLIPNANTGGKFTLSLTASSVESENGNKAFTFRTITGESTEGPVLVLKDASGNEDTAIPLSIQASLGVTDGSMVLGDITIYGVPSGAVLSAGTKNTAGIWTLSADKLTDLTITPPLNSGTDMQLTVRAVATVKNTGEIRTNEAVLNIDVIPVADIPELTVISPVNGNADAPVALSVTPVLTDTDHSEALRVEISNVPSTATLSAGSKVSDSVWALDVSDLANLTITTSENAVLTVKAISTELENGDEASVEKTIAVNVVPLITAPVANNDSAEIWKNGTPVGVSVLANDTGGELSIKSYDAASLNGGIITQNGSQLIYTPAANFVGTDSFTYKAINSKGEAGATVQVAVYGTADDHFDVLKNTSKEITISNLLQNDKLPSTMVISDFDSGFIASISQPAHGKAYTDAYDKTKLIYQPDTDYLGDDSFTYKLDDGNGNVSTATVTITVKSEVSSNIPPVGKADTFTTNQGSPKSFSAADLVSNDTDANGDTITVSTFTQPAHGTVVRTGDSFTYTPTAGFSGTDTFTYTPYDGKDAGNATTVTITVGGIPPVGNADTLTTNQDSPKTFSAADLVSNDTDVNGDTITVSAFTQPAHGTLVRTGDSFTYTPTAGFSGTDTFTYTPYDGKAAGNETTVTITVNQITPVHTLTANNDSFSMDLNVQSSLSMSFADILKNDTDSAGHTLSVSSDVSIPAHGRLDRTTTGFVYTPNAGFTGTDSFTYVVSDGAGYTSKATITIAVNKGNKAPIAAADAVTTDQDNAVTIAFSELLKNDSDPDGDTITVSSDFSNPAHGVLTKTANAFVYTPNTGYAGSDSFSYTISDGRGGTATANVAVTVKPVTPAPNNPPTAAADAVTTDQDKAVTIAFSDLLKNDSDPDSDTLSVSSDFTIPAHGRLDKTGNTFIYTPNSGYTGSDSFSYTISDGRGGTDTASVNITVNAPAVNHNPTPVNDSVSVTLGTPKTFSVLANDTDVDGDNLSISSFTQPGSGTLVKNADGTFTYTPSKTGTDSFTYKVSDGRGGEADATVNIVVSQYIPPDPPYIPPNNPPVAADDSFSVNKGATLNFTNADLLRNDSDPDSNPIAIQSFTQPSHGTLIKAADGSFIYTPAQNYVGQDSFSYTISDGTSTATATVNISILGTLNPDAKDDAVTANGVTTIEASALLSNDVAINSWDRLTISKFTQPSHGILVDNGNDTFTYTPESGYKGSDSFSYTISDGNGGTDTAAVNITVESSGTTPDPTRPPGPPVAADDRFNTVQNTPIILKASELLSNDSDPNNDPITITGIEQPYDGKLTDNQNGTFTYTPNKNFTGEDSFAYTISDGKGGTAVAVVYINVSSKDIPTPIQNQSPIAVDDIFATKLNTNLLIIKDTLLKNDSDSDGDTLSVSDMSQPSHGKLTNNGSTLTYTPDNGYIGKDSFVYVVSDGKGGTATGTVNIFVNSVTDKSNSPDAIDDTAATRQNTSVTISGQSLLANDKDPLGNPLTIIGYTQTFNGSIADKGNGTYIYTPKTDFSGLDMFSYTVSNGKGGTDTAWVKITVASSSTRSADTARRSAEPRVDSSSSSDIQRTAVTADTPPPDNAVIIIAPANTSLTVEPVVVEASVSEERSASVLKDGTPYQKETYAAVSGQKVFDVKADKNYQEWIRTAVYDRSDILAANYGGGDDAEIIRYQAYFKAKEDHNPSLWRDRNTSQSSDTGTQETGSTADTRLFVRKEAGDQSADDKAIGSDRPLTSDARNPISPLEIVDTLSQIGDMAMGFSDQVRMASGCFDTERMDFLSRLGVMA